MRRRVSGFRTASAKSQSSQTVVSQLKVSEPTSADGRSDRKKLAGQVVRAVRLACDGKELVAMAHWRAALSEDEPRSQGSEKDGRRGQRGERCTIRRLGSYLIDLQTHRRDRLRARSLDQPAEVMAVSEREITFIEQDRMGAPSEASDGASASKLESL